MNNGRQNEKRAITLHIEELILHGIPAKDHGQIARAVENGLMRLLAEGEIPPSFLHGSVIPKIDAGNFQMQRSATPQAIGEQIAQNVYGGLKR